MRLVGQKGGMSCNGETDRSPMDPITAGLGLIASLCDCVSVCMEEAHHSPLNPSSLLLPETPCACGRSRGQPSVSRSPSKIHTLPTQYTHRFLHAVTQADCSLPLGKPMTVPSKE